MSISERDQQIRQTHAPLIQQVVKACLNAEERQRLEPMLQMAREQNWHALVDRIESILQGQRDESLLLNLDEEDQVIVQAILQGLQNPETLPDPEVQADPTIAAPGLAQMIHAANHGNSEALQALANMAEYMIQVPGDMRQLGGIINRLLQGERDPDVLCKGMGPSGEQLVLNILEELNQLSPQ
ncbi:hypothetical protein [Thiohalophilus sp.]|uniref:hypothetical protein n=1 Tax=Thiohalophilus sp. TaxID=3028392 RepID=UPI002ACD7AE3|nr:hypothetical protein [Thiohalophilus sp.]MDZ7803973.1 hypothetical protein [Thiohalophilus sp.]